jgi:hypothetical protein
VFWRKLPDEADTLVIMGLSFFYGLMSLLGRRSNTPWHDRMDALEERIRRLEEVDHPASGNEHVTR